MVMRTPDRRPKYPPPAIGLELSPDASGISVIVFEKFKSTSKKDGPTRLLRAIPAGRSEVLVSLLSSRPVTMLYGSPEFQLKFISASIFQGSRRLTFVSRECRGATGPHSDDIS